MSTALERIFEYTESRPPWSVRGFNNLKPYADRGDELAVHLAQLLNSPPCSGISWTASLRYLGIARNKIGREGACALAAVLATAPQRAQLVYKVEVFCNMACPEWFDTFFIALLKGLPSLEVIDLGGLIGIGDDGDSYIALMRRAIPSAGLKRELRLREMHLDFLGLTDACKDNLLYIIESLKMNCIFLEGNAISAETLQLLVEACLLNREHWSLDSAPSAAGTMQRHVPHELPSIALDCDYGLPMLLGDRIARAVLDAFFERIPAGFCEGVRGQVVVAGFVRIRGSSLSVLSLAMGTSFVSYGGCGFSSNELVMDSHAEILARRALVHAVKCGMVEVCEADSVYLYTSTAPCGYDQKSKGCTVLNKHLAVYQPPDLCAQRRSCFAKIMRWIDPEHGWGGKHFQTKIFPLTGVVVGRKFKGWCSDRGFLPSIGTGSFESRLASVYGVVCSTTQGDSDTAWYWSPAASEFLDGRVGRTLNGTLSHIRRETLYALL